MQPSSTSSAFCQVNTAIQLMVSEESALSYGIYDVVMKVGPLLMLPGPVSFYSSMGHVDHCQGC